MAATPRVRQKQNGESRHEPSSQWSQHQQWKDQGQALMSGGTIATKQAMDEVQSTVVFEFASGMVLGYARSTGSRMEMGFLTPATGAPSPQVWHKDQVSGYAQRTCSQGGSRVRVGSAAVSPEAG